MPPRHWIDSVAITSNQELIVSGFKFSGSVAHTLEVWNVETDQIICVFPGSFRCNFGRPHSVMTPDGKILVSGDGTDIKVWSLQTAEELCTLQGHENRVEYLAITPNGQTIVSYGEDGIRVWGL